MRLRSLRFRLAFGALAAIAVAFALAAIGLEFIVGRTVERVALFSIEDQMRVLVANIEVGEDNRLILADEPKDPRFSMPYGGFYWQIGRGDKPELRSQSLWDQTLPWSHTGKTSKASVHLNGPNGIALLGSQQDIVLGTANGDESVSILVALDDSQIRAARREFLYAMAPSLVVLALALTGAVWTFLRYGLAPLDSLRTALGAVHGRNARLIEGEFPTEIQPLVDDLNALILRRDSQLTSARARAGDLAHGLKTPLAVLDAIARELERRGSGEEAGVIRGEVSRMDAHVRRTLAQARAGLAAAQSKVNVDLVVSTSQLVSTMRRIASNRGLSFNLTAPESLPANMDEADYMEICGNILDNGRKWANSVVNVTLAQVGNRVILTVDDDGPGLPETEGVLDVARGHRLDEAVAGTGFGLAIVKDLVEAYDGHLNFDRSPLGGFRVTVNLPGNALVTSMG
nr:HAMP domain-containing sensor histidine kinase [uncultured Gellertiella sp.]